LYIPTFLSTLVFQKSLNSQRRPHDQVTSSSGVSLSKKDTETLLEATFNAIGQAVCKEKRFAYPGFGTFTLRERAARKGRNPQTGATMKIKASKTIAFKPTPSLKDSL
jgi:DNA-binding protein HU-beta